MGNSWGFVAVIAGAAIACKAAGPLVVGGTSLPRPVERALEILPPTLLAALIGIAVLIEDGKVTVDARLLGFVAAAVSLMLRVPVLVAVVIAAVVTAIGRAAGI